MMTRTHPHFTCSRICTEEEEDEEEILDDFAPEALILSEVAQFTAVS